MDDILSYLEDKIARDIKSKESYNQTSKHTGATVFDFEIVQKIIEKFSSIVTKQLNLETKKIKTTVDEKFDAEIHAKESDPTYLKTLREWENSLNNLLSAENGFSDTYEEDADADSHYPTRTRIITTQSGSRVCEYYKVSDIDYDFLETNLSNCLEANLSAMKQEAKELENKLSREKIKLGFAKFVSNTKAITIAQKSIDENNELLANLNQKINHTEQTLAELPNTLTVLKELYTQKRLTENQLDLINSNRRDAYEESLSNSKFFETYDFDYYINTNYINDVMNCILTPELVEKMKDNSLITFTFLSTYDNNNSNYSGRDMFYINKSTLSVGDIKEWAVEKFVSKKIFEALTKIDDFIDTNQDINDDQNNF